MFYVDSQRTLTRRDSSLLCPARREEDARSQGAESAPEPPRRRGTARRELVTLLFDAMLPHIVESWTPIPARDERPPSTASETTLKTKKKNNTQASNSNMTGTGKPASAVAKSLVKRSKTTTGTHRMDEDTVASQQSAGALPSWLPCAEERATVVFRNGNRYEGGVSMKAMHGAGRFQWRDGTVYLGEFIDNAITGAGRLQWKHDTWYEGEFLNNLRHGRGLYVDSRRQRCYAGQWHYGTKHGKGDIHFDGSFNDCYSGDWVENVRHGWGVREYGPASEYRGGWERGRRDGPGVMLWDNHDFYKGEWKNGTMSGCGEYTWSCHRNRSMSPPTLCCYRGLWREGLRCGLGLLRLGCGAVYEGEFLENKKHGAGQLVTGDGAVVQHARLFADDNLTAPGDAARGPAKPSEPYAFDMHDARAGLRAHAAAAHARLDRSDAARERLVDDFLAACGVRPGPRTDAPPDDAARFIEFEEDALARALACYEHSLRQIYYRYATLCNDAEIHFQPQLIRLYLWQFYYDCNLGEKGVTLVELDNTFHEQRAWLSRSAHDPFEMLQFWQFRHCVVSAAARLHAPEHAPAPPRSALAGALRRFMDDDVLPNIGADKGFLPAYGRSLPLQALYRLYVSIGEPHSLRAFLCACRPTLGAPPPAAAAAAAPPRARNAYDIGFEMDYFEEDFQIPNPFAAAPEDSDGGARPDLKLFNVANVPSADIIDIFSKLFPQVTLDGAVADLEVEVTFFEFLQLLLLCVEASEARREEDAAAGGAGAAGAAAAGEGGEGPPLTDAGRMSRLSRSAHAEHS